MASYPSLADGGERLILPTVRRLEVTDILSALKKGIADFWAMPSHIFFLGLVYPVAGLLLAKWTSNQNALPLVFPLVSGFALLGPFSALGLYEVSRRRELGLETTWRHAFNVLDLPALLSILALGGLLIVIFLVWLLTAQALYVGLFGPDPPVSYRQFLYDVTTTRRGWALIATGNVIGLLFAIVTFSISVVSFPLLMDRKVSVVVAMATSIRAVLMSPATMALWGATIAAALLLGSLPILVGLTIVMPVLAHASWHIYRSVVV